MIARARAIHAEDARVDDCTDQRRDAVAIRELEARAVVDQEPCNLEMPCARRVRERRLRSPGRVTLATAIGPARPNDTGAARQAFRRLTRRNEPRRRFRSSLSVDGR